MSSVSTLNWKAAAISATLGTGKPQFRLDLVALKKLKELKAPDNRVIYARKAGDEVIKAATLENGDKITLEGASELKEYCWGSASMPPKNEWLKQGICLHPPDQMWAYGVVTQRNGTKNFLMCLQAYFLKHLLFEKKGKGKEKRFRRYPKAGVPRPSGGTGPGISWSQLLKPNDKAQQDMVANGLADILLRAADGDEAILALNGQENCFEPSAQYGIDGYTEKLNLFRTKKEEEMRGIIKKFLPTLMQENGVGLLCFLYSVLLSRNFDRLKEDMQDQCENSLIDPMGECTLPLLNLILFGKATPYLHNGSMMIEDEHGVHQERHGIANRSDIGFLLWEKDEDRTARHNIGSRLKTPSYPLWVTRCNEQMGVLFNPNKELMRSHNAENRFQLYYYSHGEFKKGERKETVLTIDTRTRVGFQAMKTNNDVDFDEGVEPPLELLVKTKWEGSTIDWNGMVPYVW